MTDVGARCPTCAPSRKLPQFELGALWLLRGAAAAILSGLVLGSLWRLALPGNVGFFGLVLALLLGYGVGEAVSWATNRKSGPPLQLIATGGVIVAYLTRNLLLGDPPIPGDDLFGYMAVIAAAVVAAGRLRY